MLAGLPGRHDAGLEEHCAPPGRKKAAAKLILPDTSVWIDHFRSGDKDLQKALSQGQIVIHSWIIAELALGSLREQAKTLATLDLLPRVRVAQLTRSTAHD